MLNNLEFDHADIFADLDAIKLQFHHLLRTVPRSGAVIWNQDEPALREVLARGCWSQQLGFGAKAGDWLLQQTATGFAVSSPTGGPYPLNSSLAGRHNAMNAVAALAAVAAAGIDPTKALAALPGFRGVKRRLEHLGTIAGVSVFDDFAHHPTAIAATVEALAERAPGARRIGVLEMRSNSMRAGAHRAGLAAALHALDGCYVLAPNSLSWDIHETLAPLGKRCQIFTDTRALLSGLIRDSVAGDQVLIMSNGGFDGLHQRLLEALTRSGAGDSE